MNKIDTSLLRTKVISDTVGGDFTLESIIKVANKVNELIDERNYDNDSVNIWRESMANALELHHSASWAKIMMEIGRLKAQAQK